MTFDAKRLRPKAFNCMKNMQRWATPSSNQHNSATPSLGLQVMTRPLPKSSAKSWRRARLQHKIERKNQGPDRIRQPQRRGTKSTTSSCKLTMEPIHCLNVRLECCTLERAQSVLIESVTTKPANNNDRDLESPSPLENWATRE